MLRHEKATVTSDSSLRVWVWPLLLATTIIFASSFGRVAGPSVPGFDKVAHFFVYGLLGTLLVRVPAFSRRGATGAMLAIVAVALFGVTDEYHQSWVPGRESDALDLLVDTAGATLAVLLYCRWGVYRRLLEFSGRYGHRTTSVSTTSVPEHVA